QRTGASSGRAVAAIDEEIRSGHETGRVARQKECRSRDLLRQSESPQEMLWPGYPACSLDRTEVVDETLSLDRTGRKRVYSNADGCMIHGHRPRELDQRALGAAVRGVPRRGDTTEL